MQVGEGERLVQHEVVARWLERQGAHVALTRVDEQQLIAVAHHEDATLEAATGATDTGVVERRAVVEREREVAAFDAKSRRRRLGSAVIPPASATRAPVDG